MRYLVCLIGGALLGALFAVMLTNILARRHAYPKALMTVMQHELGRAHDLVRGERCMTPEAAAPGAPGLARDERVGPPCQQGQ